MLLQYSCNYFALTSILHAQLLYIFRSIIRDQVIRLFLLNIDGVGSEASSPYCNAIKSDSSLVTIKLLILFIMFIILLGLRPGLNELSEIFEKMTIQNKLTSNISYINSHSSFLFAVVTVSFLPVHRIS